MDEAATKIQGLFRRKHAKIIVKARAEGQYRRIFEPTERRYVYLNRRTGSWHDEKPRLLDELELGEVAMRGLMRMQAIMRRKLARKIIISRKQEVGPVAGRRQPDMLAQCH